MLADHCFRDALPDAARSAVAAGRLTIEAAWRFAKAVAFAVAFAAVLGYTAVGAVGETIVESRRIRSELRSEHLKRRPQGSDL